MEMGKSGNPIPLPSLELQGILNEVLPFLAFGETMRTIPRYLARPGLLLIGCLLVLPVEGQIGGLPPGLQGKGKLTQQQFLALQQQQIQILQLALVRQKLAQQKAQQRARLATKPRTLDLTPLAPIARIRGQEQVLSVLALNPLARQVETASVYKTSDRPASRFRLLEENRGLLVRPEITLPILTSTSRMNVPILPVPPASGQPSGLLASLPQTAVAIQVPPRPFARPEAEAEATVLLPETLLAPPTLPSGQPVLTPDANPRREAGSLADDLTQPPRPTTRPLPVFDSF